jgi:hypothetical protein
VTRRSLPSARPGALDLGRFEDAALIGGGFSMELAPDAKVFVDYDGRLGSRAGCASDFESEGDPQSRVMPALGAGTHAFLFTAGAS